MKYLEERKNKIIILKDFIKLNSDLAEQGSLAWLEERKFIIGGSEISSIVGKNPFSNIQGLIAQKIGLSHFTGNTPTRWGNLFENVSELLFQTMFVNNCRIYATGSIQHKSIVNHRYSPDGLCCMMYLNNGEKTYKTTLLEFKSPYSSVPTVKVPSHYLPQVKAGLCTIDIAEIAIFNNNMYRKCALKQLDFSIDYDNKYHRDNEKKLTDINVTIANGIILFSIKSTKIKHFNKKYYNLSNTSSSSLSSDEDDIKEPVIIRHNLEFLSNDIHTNDKFPDSESDDEYMHFDDGTNILRKFYRNIALYESGAYKSNKNINTTLVNNLIDLGNESKEMFDQFLLNYKSDSDPSFIDIKCVKPQINRNIIASTEKNFVLAKELDYIKEDEYLDNICKKYNFEKIINKFVDKCIINDSVPIAYLPWKLLRSSNIIVEKDVDYLHNIKDSIDKTIEIIKNITDIAGDCLDKRADLFEYHFNDNQVTKNHYENKKHTVDFIKDFL